MTEPTLDRASIERNLGRFETAFARGDATAVASAYTEDAQLLEGAHVINGRRAICESWRTLREQRGVRELSLTVQQVEVSEDMAYHLGDGSMRLQEAEGQTRSVPFTYVIIWRRRPDGAWKIVVDIVSSEAPVGRER